MVLITMEDCPRCGDHIAKNPTARVVRAEDLMSGEYKEPDHNDLRMELAMSDGLMPIVLENYD